MFGKTSMALHQAEITQDVFLSAAAFASGTECATMILDGLGRIRYCGAVEEIFGASRLSLIGRPVSEFIAGLSLGRSSPSYDARYLVYLCADGEWHRFEATETGGRAFAVEVSMHRTQVSGQELFVLSLRWSKQAVCP